MRKAASVFLRAEIYRRDVARMILWMENPHVVRYLNEEHHVVQSLRTLMATTPEPLLALQLNRTGRFLLICGKDDRAIGFVKLKPLRPGCHEIVFVIGEEGLWGNGYGRAAIEAALSMAFLEWRADEIIARIDPQNLRSIRAAGACGLTCAEDTGRLHTYAVTFDGYLAWARERRKNA